MADNESIHIGDIETRYRAQVIERYNRLGFAGLGVGDLRLSDVALDDVFVRLTLTVEKIVREPIPSEEWEREERSRNPFHRGGKKEDDRPRERTVTVQQPISLSDALAQHALIVGEPGAGKSTLLRWLAVTFANRKQQEADRLGPQAEADRLPLLVELGRLPEAYLKAESRETPNWKLFLPEHLTKQPPFDDIPAAFLAQALAEGRCLLLCDGLDEIADLSARRRIADSLADYARSSANRLVLSSRPAGVSGSEGSLGARFQRLTIQRFTPEDVRRFFGFLYAQNPELTPEEQKKEADALYGAVQAAPKTLELATTPLLAALLLLLWNENGYLPERRVELYERCCRMLIESWEAQHDVAYTGVLAEIGWERHLRLLAPLAYAIHNTGQRTDAPASELIPVLAQAMQDEGLAPPASATLEAEKFLRTLSLRSGLLQFLGGDRYGFPHLTFQEYLTARHIAAQPDPDYIDLVMPHLHKAWWREVHLLVIGHLGSGSEGAEKMSRLLQQILEVYPAPWRLLRSMRFNPWVPDWLRYLMNTYEDSRILKWPIHGFAYVIVLPPALPGLMRNSLAAQARWQWERRLAWVLAREFCVVATDFRDCVSLRARTELAYVLKTRAKIILQAFPTKHSRFGDGDENPVKMASWVLRCLDNLPDKDTNESDILNKLKAFRVPSFDTNSLERITAKTVCQLLKATCDADPDYSYYAWERLVMSRPESREAMDVVVNALLDESWRIRATAADLHGEWQIKSSEALLGLEQALDDSDIEVQRAAARSLVTLGQVSDTLVSMANRNFDDTGWSGRFEILVDMIRLRPDLTGLLAALVYSLDDFDESVYWSAFSALIRLPLEVSEVRATLLESLDGPLGFSKVIVARSLAQRGLASCEVVRTLLSTLGDSDGRVRQVAASSLGELGEAISTGLGQALEEVVSALVTALSDSDFDVRKAAAISLGQLGEASGVAAQIAAALLRALGDSEVSVREAAAGSLGQLGNATEQVVSALVGALSDSEREVRSAATVSLSQLKIEDETQLCQVLIALNRRLHDRDDNVRRAALTAIRRLLDGRQIPGYHWVPIRERRERAKRRRILGYWVLGISMAVLVAWVAAGVTTYLSLDEFWVRFVGVLAALVALAAGGVQVLGYFRRPPWDR